MRVISGKKRGTKLECPGGDNVRPTTDRIKESLFNIIQNSVFNSVVLDIFSGSGALGIEALSRGAKAAYFIDNSRESIKYLQKNLAKTGFSNESNILLGNALSEIKKLSSKNIQFDLVFLDPPYKMNLIDPVLAALSESQLVHEDTLIVVEHSLDEEVPESIGGLTKFNERKYGKTTKISFLKLEE